MTSIRIHHHARREAPESRPDPEVMLGQRSPTPLEFDACYGRVWVGELVLPQPNAMLQLAALYELVEAGGPGCPIPRVVGHPDGPIRSFMAGDVIELDGVAYYVAEWGFKPATISD